MNQKSLRSALVPLVLFVPVLALFQNCAGNAVDPRALNATSEFSESADGSEVTTQSTSATKSFVHMQACANGVSAIHSRIDTDTKTGAALMTWKNCEELKPAKSLDPSAMRLFGQAADVLVYDGVIFDELIQGGAQLSTQIVCRSESAGIEVTVWSRESDPKQLNGELSRTPAGGESLSSNRTGARPLRFTKEGKDLVFENDLETQTAGYLRLQIEASSSIATVEYNLQMTGHEKLVDLTECLLRLR